MSAYEAHPWTDFAVAVAGIGAVLAGLVFVAVSVNLESIVTGPRLAGRAANSLILFSTPAVLCILLLIPDQSRGALGVELIVVGVLIAPCLAVLNRPWGRPPQWILAAWLIGGALPAAVLVVTTVIAGVGEITENLGGLYWLPVGIVVAYLGALLNTWGLLVEIKR
ncbi:MAG: hypothetical protein JWR88_1770 [Pseudonocardia sp.]|nr:hypothetical protein [Pseudonocardia sp.]